MIKKIVIAAALMLSLNLSAHEGHNQTPGSLKANHGGTVKPGKEINLEYVVSGSEVKFYPASHEGSDIAAKDVKISATAKLPKGKPEKLNVELKDGTYVATVDFKNAYRVEVITTTEHNGKKDTFKLQVEK